MSDLGGSTEDMLPDAAAVQTPPSPKLRSVMAFYKRAGMPSITDLGLDAMPGETSGEDDAQGDEPAAAAVPPPQDITGFPGERVSHIAYGFEGERWRIRNAVWVMAQSPLGEKVLAHIYAGGFRITFDAQAIASEKFQSFVNTVDRVIVLDSRASAERLVVDLALQASLASASRDGLFWDTAFSPPAALLVHRMATAYAASMQLQIAYELRTATTLPAHADKGAYWRLMARIQHRISGTFAQAAINDMALEQGAAAGAAIREFYHHASQRSRVDREVINFYKSLPQSTLKDPKAMTMGIDPTAAAYKLTFPGLVYAMTHDPEISLTAPENVAVAEEIDTAVQFLQGVRKNAGVKDREMWQIPHRHSLL